MRRRAAATFATVGLLGALTAPNAMAEHFESDPHFGHHPPADGTKCNAGRGNGSELVTSVDCDPGNSGGRNQGGD